jgi:glycosyltransferase involved in cell wall biosynthesis
MTIGLRTALRQWFGPLTLHRAARHLHEIVARVQPDLVHAMRIPYEGMLAALALRPAPGRAQSSVPLVISVWGNDFTLHARSTPLMASLTRRALRQANALHADCQRDVRLARGLGFPASLPVLVIPGNGGVHTDIFHPPPDVPRTPVVFNPRGLRAYVRNDTFFRAIPLVLERHPGVIFRCAAMAGQREALEWVNRLGIREAVELLEPRPHSEMAEIFRSAQVVVSPSIHDGVPNTLLEAMACGCLPVAGDLESIREWITHGVNGLLIDPSSPRSLADGILTALDNAGLRLSAVKENTRIIAERAEYGHCMAMAQAFYERVLREP